MAQAEAPARENLFTKKAEKVFFQQARDEAEAAGKVAVLLKGFDNHEKNMILDDRAMKIKNANKEHTIIVRSCCCPDSAPVSGACGQSAHARVARFVDMPFCAAVHRFRAELHRAATGELEVDV